MNENDEIDSIIKESREVLKKSAEDILAERKAAGKDISTDVSNNKDGKLPLGDLGEFDKVSREELDTVLDKLATGIIFKLGKCVFRVSAINKGQKRFTAELINGRD